jgi:protein-S-isoprenylcysteine O-methyltransferase Ste14
VIEVPAVVDVSIGACWWAVLVVRIAGAVAGALYGHRERRRDRSGLGFHVLAIVLCGAAVLAAYDFLHSLVFDTAWAEAIGLFVLPASTGFAIWARLALGRMWSVGPEVGGDGSLRTTGPYGVTRHPIYTGLLGMIIGTMLLAGGHELIALILVGLVLFEVKIYQEERLMVETFLDEYADYRRRVPEPFPVSSSCVGTTDSRRRVSLRRSQTWHSWIRSDEPRANGRGRVRRSSVLRPFVRRAVRPRAAHPE